MINLFLKPIEECLKECEWLEVWGGLIRVFDHPILNENGSIKETLTYPVVCNADLNQCENQDPQVCLIPSDEWRSMAYLELIRFAKDRNNKTKHESWSGSVRLVVWLNLAKLGINSCDQTCLFTASIIKKLNSKKSNYDLGFPAHVKIKVEREENNKRNIFSAYSPKLYRNWMLYPCDYFALDISIQALFDPKCLPEPTIGEPIECLNLAL